MPSKTTGSNQATLNRNATITATFPDQSGLGTHALPHLYRPTPAANIALSPETALVQVETKPTVIPAVQTGSTSPQVVSTATVPVATSLADPPSNAPHPGDHPHPDQSVYNSKFEDHQRSQATLHTTSLSSAVIANSQPTSLLSQGLISLYAPPITKGSFVYSLNAISTRRRSFFHGGSAITVSEVPVQILWSDNSIVVSSSSTSLRPYVPRSSALPSTLKVDRVPITAEQPPRYITASQTLLPGDPVTAGGIKVALVTDSAGSPQLVAGASTVRLVVTSSQSPTVFNGIILTPKIVYAYTIAEQTLLRPGVVTVSITRIALSTSQADQNVLVVGSDSSVLVDATHTSSFEPIGSSLGNQVTISGTILSLDTGGTQIVVGGSNISNSTAAPSRRHTAIESLSAGNKSETRTIANATITSGFVGRASGSATANSIASSSQLQNPSEISVAG